MAFAYLNRAKELAPELISWRRTLHKNPEIGFELTETVKFVVEKLRSFGYEPQLVGKAGVSVTVGAANGGPVIMLRADMDALPMREESGLEFASCNGYDHACGHDIHTTALLGAAKLLKERENQLRGTVKLMFQPCEERMHGAQDMVDNGLMDNPKVDAAMAMHVVHEAAGYAHMRSGYAGASSDLFKITIHGVGCHGAAPNNGVDPINIGAHLVLALQAMNSREVSPDEMLVCTVCMISAGTAPNIIPDECVLQGSIRTAHNEVREFAKKRLVEISQGTAATFRATATVEFEGDGIPPMVNDPALFEEMTGYINGMLGDGAVREIPAMTGSEDFSVVGELVPSVLVWFGTGNEAEGYPYGVHNPKVTFNEESIYKMSAVYAQCAENWLEKRG